MFYDSLNGLCEQRGASTSKVLDELKMSRGSLFRWKKGGAPRNEYKKKIADYFGVSRLVLEHTGTLVIAAILHCLLITS